MYTTWSKLELDGVAYAPRTDEQKWCTGVSGAKLRWDLQQRYDKAYELV